MTKIWHIPTLIALSLLHLQATCQAEVIQRQPLNSIANATTKAAKTRAEEMGYDNVRVEVRPLDESLQLPLCAQPLSTFITSASPTLGATNIGVRCLNPEAWTIYVRAHVTAQREVPVLSRAIARNSILKPSDLVFTEQPLDAEQNGVIYDAEQLVGMELTRSLNAGATIRTNQIRPPKVIIRGQQVILIAGEGGLNVSMQGKALTDASAGERVKVKNINSGQQVEGIANTDGSVTVP